MRKAAYVTSSKAVRQVGGKLNPEVLDKDQPKQNMEKKAPRTISFTMHDHSQDRRGVTVQEGAKDE
jgi:hypothetical protein